MSLCLTKEILNFILSDISLQILIFRKNNFARYDEQKFEKKCINKIHVNKQLIRFFQKL